MPSCLVCQRAAHAPSSCTLSQPPPPLGASAMYPPHSCGFRDGAMFGSNPRRGAEQLPPCITTIALAGGRKGAGRGHSSMAETRPLQTLPDADDPLGCNAWSASSLNMAVSCIYELRQYVGCETQAFRETPPPPNPSSRHGYSHPQMADYSCQGTIPVPKSAPVFIE